MYSLLLLASVAFLASLLLTPVVRDCFRKLGLVDLPSERKIHQHPIPRMGGVAIVLSYLTAYGVLLLLHVHGTDSAWVARAHIWELVPAAAVIFAVGLVDDLFGLKPWQKLAGQLVAAAIAFGAGVRVNSFGGHAFNPWFSLPLTVIWLLACTNAVNLIDGIDGLAAGIGLFATCTTLLAALLQGNVELALATVPLAGALLGFLRYNFNPATIFLGDSGSLFVGFLLGCYGVLWSQKSATILGMTAPLMALAIPLLDTALAIVRRFIHNQPIFGADRGHIHHRLLDRGFTPRKVTLLLYACCAAGAICSLCMMNSTASGVVIIVFCASAWIGIQHLGYVEFGVVGRMFIEGAFRRQISAQIAIQSFEQRIDAASTTDDCWVVIREAAKGFGFESIRMQLCGESFGEGEWREHSAAWRVHLPVGGSDWVELARAFDLNMHSTAIACFAAAIRKALATKTFKRPVSNQQEQVAAAQGA